MSPRRTTAKAAQAAFDHYSARSSSGLLTADEEEGMVACLPRLADLAEEMGVLSTPISDWTREEMMRFLTLAVRAAVPIRQVFSHTPDMNDRIPFDFAASSIG